MTWWPQLFQKLARHVPGLGGPAGLDSLTLEEAMMILKQTTADLKREAAAMGAP